MLVRACLFLGPLAASLGTTFVLVRWLPAPTTLAGQLSWLVLVSAPSTLVFLVSERMARRLVPLATLLRLSLAFPDHVPSRFAVALRSGNLRAARATARAHAQGAGSAAISFEQVLTLASALQAHDRRTRGHSERVRAFTELLARELALPAADLERLRWAALLHDIGKLTVPPEILNKPGRPDPDEWAVLSTHPAAGARIAAPLAGWMGSWLHAIDEHHERFDGTGYPRAIAGREISLAGRIVAVTDAFETMTAVRAYKKSMSAVAAREELVRCAGSHFDPMVVRAFLEVSLARLRWTTGLASWCAQLPLIGFVPRAGARLALSTPAVAAGAGTLGGVAAVTVAASLSLGPAVSADAASAPPPDPAPVLAPTSGGRDIGVRPDPAPVTVAQSATDEDATAQREPTTTTTGSGTTRTTTSPPGTGSTSGPVDPAPTPAPVTSPTSTTKPGGSGTTSGPYESPGGSISVHHSGGTITLASSTPAPGFTQEIHDNGPDRVEVRFDNGAKEWRIRVDLEKGALVVDVSLH